MPLVSPDTVDQYANDYKNNEVTAALMCKLEPAISPKTRCYLDPDIIDTALFDQKLYQNACIYVTYEHEEKNFLLVTLNKPRGIKDSAADKHVLTPGGRRDKDHGLVYTALKEMEEESHLMVDVIAEHVPQAMFRHLQTNLIYGKRGTLNFQQQLHCYHLDLGSLDAEQIKNITQDIKGDSDVGIAEFVDVTGLQTTEAHQPFNVTTMQKPLLDGVAQIARGLRVKTKAVPFSEILSQLSEQEKDTKVTTLLRFLKECPQEDITKKQQLSRMLLLSVKLENLITLAGEEYHSEVVELIKNYAHCSPEDFKEFDKYYRASQSFTTFSTSKTQQIRKSLSDSTISDQRRFELAQSYVLDEPNKHYSMFIRKHLIASISIPEKTLQMAIPQ
ncbi:hypothetical protein J2N86_07730 [Legionella lytica]|uniref:Nudix hydrolase domain-containing protein n=1 Tax=Legionella lytica TaxID=96232 RepID=A0ABY4Y4T9_9GAMM|nr:hypothetical protein [Legionella lytica]USQ12609.1 hypothetical protein J2N86_07730 [Legionella lytica]